MAGSVRGSLFATLRDVRSNRIGPRFRVERPIRRAVVSAMSNIAEGFARKTDRDFAHFLDMVRGSCSDVQSLLYIALDVGHLS